MSQTHSMLHPDYAGYAHDSNSTYSYGYGNGQYQRNYYSHPWQVNNSSYQQAGATQNSVGCSAASGYVNQANYWNDGRDGSYPLQHANFPSSNTSSARSMSNTAINSYSYQSGQWPVNYGTSVSNVNCNPGLVKSMVFNTVPTATYLTQSANGNHSYASSQPPPPGTSWPQSAASPSSYGATTSFYGAATSCSYGTNIPSFYDTDTPTSYGDVVAQGSYGATITPGSYSATIAPSSYGTATPTSYGATIAPGSYGTTVPPSSYGTATPTSYGATIALSSYGAANLNLYGASTPSSYGVVIAPSSYGATIAPSACAATVVPSSYGATATPSACDTTVALPNAILLQKPSTSIGDVHYLISCIEEEEQEAIKANNLLDAPITANLVSSPMEVLSFTPVVLDNFDSPVLPPLEELMQHHPNSNVIMGSLAHVTQVGRPHDDTLVRNHVSTWTIHVFDPGGCTVSINSAQVEPPINKFQDAGLILIYILRVIWVFDPGGIKRRGRRLNGEGRNVTPVYPRG